MRGTVTLFPWEMKIVHKNATEFGWFLFNYAIRQVEFIIAATTSIRFMVCLRQFLKVSPNLIHLFFFFDVMFLNTSCDFKGIYYWDEINVELDYQMSVILI